MSMTILGLGVAAPPALSQTDAAELARARCCDSPQQSRLLSALYRQTTVTRRGSVLLAGRNGGGDGDEPDAAPTEAMARFYQPPNGHPAPRGPTIAQRMRQYADRAPALALEAARAALDDADVAPRDVAQLVVVSCTGFSSPGVEFSLIDTLGLTPTVGRTNIGFMGCHGAINGLRVADALAHCQPGRPILLCAVELCSLHFQYGWDPGKVVANALFADGAAAVVGMVHAPPPAADRMRVLATGSCVLPDSRDDMTWTIADHGFEMTLSPRAPALIERHLSPWLGRWLGERGLTVGQVGCWAIHPGGPRIVDAVERALTLTPEATAASRRVLAEHGNMSSPTILFILQRLLRQAAPLPCVALAFGPGMVVEGALLGA